MLVGMHIEPSSVLCFSSKFLKLTLHFEPGCSGSARKRAGRRLLPNVVYLMLYPRM